jgi:hypothetical protein
MKFKSLLPLIIGASIALLTDCKPGVKNDIKQPDAQDTTIQTQDTTKKTTDPTSVNSNKKADPALADYLAYLHEQFDHLASPFEARYTGFSIGDYPHIIFKDKNGKEYDFGDGENSFGAFKEEEILDENSKYTNKMFKVTWEWKTSSFNCCEGEMNLMTAKVPSILNLELVK